MENRGKIQHRSMRGVIVDMEALKMKYATSPAIGNTRMNANGDVIAKDGHILVHRHEIVQAYYANNPNGVKQTSLKETTAETFETPQQVVERLTSEINKTKPPQTEDPNILDKNKRKLVDKP